MSMNFLLVSELDDGYTLDIVQIQRWVCDG
jgi:hypothetical protein